MTITIRQIAKAVGVSVATVSRVLTRSDHAVNAETSQRVWAMADQLGYRPNYVARGLRTERTHTTGVITDDITGAFTPPIVRAVLDRLEQDGYYCVLINADRNPARQEEAVHNLLAHGVDGLIFVESWHHSVTTLLQRVGKPYVYVHRQFEQTFYPSVIPDELFGARLAVRHLVEQGHRCIGYISGPSHYYVSAVRQQAYQTVLAEAGIPLDAALVAQGDWSILSGYQGMNAILRARPLPTAVFAANDLMAVGAIYALQDARLQTPADIAVVGYDNREIATQVRPALTTVTLPCYEMGQAAAELLLQLLDPLAGAGDGSVNEPVECKVRGKLIIRDSCGARQLAVQTE